jgi:branched-chain amino acid transport system permease protein
VGIFGTIAIDATSYAAWLFLISIGLTLVFGVLKLLNVAHGGFYAVGAYMAAYAIGIVARAGWGTAGQFAAAAVATVLVGAILGLAIERSVLARLYRQPEAMILIATYAVFLILDDSTKQIWGGESLYANGPRDSLGLVRLGALQYPVYDIALIGLAIAAAALTWFVLHATRIGHCVTAVVIDREMSAAMGINVGRVMTGTFVAGATLGALSGALTAPKIALSPGMGVEVIVIAFAVVVVGGLGSIPGAVLGAVIIGIAHAVTAHLFPQLELFAVYAVMAGVLALRPHGLLAGTEARKI